MKNKGWTPLEGKKNSSHAHIWAAGLKTILSCAQTCCAAASRTSAWFCKQGIQQVYLWGLGWGDLAAHSPRLQDLPVHAYREHQETLPPCGDLKRCQQLLCSTGNTGDFTFDFRKLTKSSGYLSLLFLFTQCPLTGAPALALADDTRRRSAAAAQTCRMHGSRTRSYSPPSPYVQVQYLNLSDTFTSHKCPHPGGIMIYCNFEIIQQLFSHFRVQTTTLVSLQINY